MSKIVLALGGNALGSTPVKQLELVKTTSAAIVDIIESGNDVVIAHGNGPQVGMINLAMSMAAATDDKIPEMPYPECGAMSQGYIGYHLQQAIGHELEKRGIQKNVATIVTQVVVDENDPAFTNPTKPVGRFYTKEEADRLQAEGSGVFKEDAGRGYRRVIASPEPKRIVELETVRKLNRDGDIVITVGGGGIPVVETTEGLKGVAGVIDKDRSAAKLAGELGADVLMILTAVDRVCLGFNTENERSIEKMTVGEAKEYAANGEFAPGSMLPKIEACISFLDNNPQGRAVIASLENAKTALTGESGTVIKA